MSPPANASAPIGRTIPSLKPPRIPAPTGRSMTAQGNALGFPVPWISALKGRPIRAAAEWDAPSGLDSFWLLSQGVALGWDGAGLWPFRQNREKGVAI